MRHTHRTLWLLILGLLLAGCSLVPPIPGIPNLFPDKTPVPVSIRSAQRSAAALAKQARLDAARRAALRPVTELLERITEARELSRTIRATQEALAKGGVATADLDGMLVPAVPPATSVIALPEETLLLTRDARKYAYAKA